MVKAKVIKNRTKTSAFTITFRIALYVAPLCLASAGSEQSSDAGKVEVPGVPNKAVQYNKNDITPVAQMEQVKARLPSLLSYRNIAMLTN